ncbi:hypothetical protein CVT24_008433 [Panaeolus cyanescens]|uniref:Uncharacterized protein n=1 Tax=Panaeolus cyanescens TaxID=181874 RepID=A0A409VBK1_9AGAR|nr:hypothetical protein CVT24_008433 [Panaeolus cyanescens]
MSSQTQPLLTEADYYYPLGVCFEAFFFGEDAMLLKAPASETAKLNMTMVLGIYTVLFIAALWIWQRRRLHARVHALSGMFYLIMIILMWIVAGLHLVVNTVAVYFITHPTVVSPSTSYNWFRPVFPLVFAQNVITTGLLTYKVWSQYRLSNANGLVNTGGGVTLGNLTRILIETVMVYPFELFIIIVLGAIQHPAKGMVVVALVPTIGIVFVLLSVRVHFGRSLKPNATRGTAASDFPDLFKDSISDRGIEHERPGSRHSIDLVQFKMGNDKLTSQHSNAEDRDPFPAASFSRKQSAEGPKV